MYLRIEIEGKSAIVKNMCGKPNLRSLKEARLGGLEIYISLTDAKIVNLKNTWCTTFYDTYLMERSRRFAK